MNHSRDGIVSTELSDDVTPAVSVVRAVTDAAAADQTQLDPLADVVPVDALNRIARASQTRLSFEYEGYAVDIADGEITLYPTGEHPEGQRLASDD